MYIQKFKQDFLRNYFADLSQNFYECFQVRLGGGQGGWERRIEAFLGGGVRVDVNGEVKFL